METERLSPIRSTENSLINKINIIPITINENNVFEGAVEILKVIRPLWKNDDIKFKLFTDGISNKLVGCFHKKNGDANDGIKSLVNGYTHQTELERQHDHQQKNCNKQSGDDVILIRVYGNKTDLFIDRVAETKNIQLLHLYGLAPRLYATFQNGLAYEYVPGVVMCPKTVILPNIWPLIARKMAEMHKIKAIEGFDDSISVPPSPLLWNKIEQFLNLIPEQFTNSSIHERVCDQFLPVKRLRDEFHELTIHLMKLNSPIVFCHNDLLLGNVIYDETIDKITFIDYEYAGYNFQAYDIGNHFTEFAGIDEIDYSLYPTKEFQHQWLRIYLEKFRSDDQNNNVTQEDIDKLYVQVNQFALASHFFWTVWSLIQAEHSTIDFDFVRFAKNRYNEYLAKKDIFMALSDE